MQTVKSVCSDKKSKNLSQWNIDNITIIKHVDILIKIKRKQWFSDIEMFASNEYYFELSTELPESIKITKIIFCDHFRESMF